MKLFRIIFLIALVASVPHLKAQKLQLTVEEAKAYALQHNKELKNARKDILISDAQIKEAIGQGLPQVSGQMDYMTNFNYESELDFGGTSEPPQIDIEKLDAGDLELLSFLSQSMGSTGPATIIMNDQMNAQLRVSQLIFSGQYWLGLETARIGKKLARTNMQMTELEVKETVINTYYMVQITKKYLNILEENLSNLQEVLQHTSNMYKAGVLEKTDADQIKTNLSQLENSKKSMERNLLMTYNMLRLQLGVESSRQIELSEDIDEILKELGQENLLNESYSLEANPSFQMMETREEMSEKMLEMQQWAYAPTLTGFYSYTEKILQANFDLSPNHAAGVTLSVPIFSGFTKKAQVDQARIELDKVQTSKELLKDQLQLQENQLKFNLRSAYENFLAQQQNVEIAKSVYNSIHHKYRQGIMSSLDLSQANSNYLQAENNYVSSIFDLLQAKLNLDKLYNRL